MPNLAARVEFFFGGTSGDVTVLKCDTDDVTELVLSGIFKIDRQGFFMGPEGGFSPKNAFSHDFVDTKLTCNLLAVQRDVVYASTQCDFPSIILNIRALEKLVPLKKGESLLSSVCESRGMPCIRLSHALFIKKEDDDDPDNIARIGMCLPHHLILHSLMCASEDATMAWPVQDDNREALNRAASTHYISPLPAFDVNGKPIQPVDYQRVLSGAVVEAQFTLLHYFIKGDRKSIFTTSLCEMCILCAPLRGPVNPFKWAHQGLLNSFGDNKRSRLVGLPHIYGMSASSHCRCHADLTCKVVFQLPTDISMLHLT
ncbi:hypothetical protein M404DRAFT_131598 [Pisolithus tinctorius Marx 270]|uniref:Uncharacterized protein n=1 Tax=Pisolithus tinctorius Marx 270 TaxID=870435 RepID=A0A0C3KIN8_PISTI|nr:hypothetical protein M404DRAFT_131598 [Pisolithus tinctorius Marx 270]